MNIQIKAENLTLDERLKNYICDKVHMLTKYLGDIHIIDIKVKVSLTSKHHQKGNIYACEMALVLPGDTLRVSKTTSDVYKAVDKVKDHLVLLIKKYKDTHDN